MYMDVKELLDRMDFQSEMIAVAIIVVALLLILFLNRKRLRLRLREWLLQRRLNQIGSEQIRDLLCADGLDGYYSIDRLALTGDCILLLSYKPHVGNIYCAEQISEWTQLIGQKSYKFANPLFELENQLTALKLIVGNVPLRGFLLFNDSASFPKGHPPAVLQPDSIPRQFLRDRVEPANADVRDAWEQLKAYQATAPTVDGLGVKT